ncbi:NAD(P)/FAD-dependent oxidoreductase [Fulvivirga ligni]|uniref:NAD(P)/FAD-dependent oxidoreductase n=1 Tax=Fulvivirga ligni TaxID=2904246 RepID=UPI001F26CE98|nr:geranylgeranyl reductase family protein [Fulvivirga ligni]UII20174.1 geranylgeranyl reductase family protein [Fulvivirga ligni]
MNQNNHFDVIIIGAGPAGTAAAIELGKANAKVAVIDKAVFPRDKTCGDALSVDVINQLEKLSPELAQDFQSLSDKTASYGVKIVAPNQKEVEIPFLYQGEEKCGYICPRLSFDHLLFKHMKSYSSVEVFEGQKVSSIIRTKDVVSVITEGQTFSAPLIIGADGAQSVVAKQLAEQRLDKKHHSGGLRVYYEQIEGFTSDNKIELHFFKNILPGYLWIFPLPNGKANVGLGMLSSVISSKKINLKEVLKELLSNHPSLKERFSTSKPLESIKGFGLPLGSKKRSVSGDNYLLTGDAAGLIDPFSGEGIGNALRSGRFAADHALLCLKTNDFSKEFNVQYDNYLFGKIWNELQISHTLQRLCKYPRVFNFVVNKARKSPHVHNFLVDSLANVSVKKHLSNPVFYFKLLFR